MTTGSYTGLAEFAAGEGVRVSYEKNTAPGVFTLWGSSPNAATNTTLTAPPPGLGAGEYLTRVRWEYGQAAPGMQASARPVARGTSEEPRQRRRPGRRRRHDPELRTLTACTRPARRTSRGTTARCST